MVATLIVFRNAISHVRYNEARTHLANMKNSLRTISQMVCSGGLNVNSGPRYNTYKSEAREISKQLQVRGDPVSPCDVYDARN